MVKAVLNGFRAIDTGEQRCFGRMGRREIDDPLPLCDAHVSLSAEALPVSRKRWPVEYQYLERADNRFAAKILLGKRFFSFKKSTASNERTSSCKRSKSPNILVRFDSDSVSADCQVYTHRRPRPHQTCPLQPF